MKISSKKIMTVLFCAYIAAIALACFIKGDNIPDVQMTIFGIPTDKFVHFCMFAPFTVISFQAFHPSGASKARLLMLLAILAVSGAGLAYGTEQLQGLTDYRSCDIMDFYADLMGLACGTAAILGHIIFRKK